PSGVGVHAENHFPSKDRNRSLRRYGVGFRLFPSPASWNSRMRHAASVRPEKNIRWICSDDKYRAMAVAANSSRPRRVTRIPLPTAASEGLPSAFLSTIARLAILELTLTLSKKQIKQALARLNDRPRCAIFQERFLTPSSFVVGREGSEIATPCGVRSDH